ncbi:hypothetical protein BOTBODRAFT_266767 [Botryobasidium botryosum FD-172 SS1]|uniref:Uncharacterized protein n=1 Tax=Botryobasidium botryosum (strain FD-172 SS1) TaxID=930990 RepID=A0A067MVZ1_BOTB1|nr:hypothetical protein BOTBODRAFT_266767 [Botryobasidium botryosum FD-172 SS1]
MAPIFILLPPSTFFHLALSLNRERASGLALSSSWMQHRILELRSRPLQVVNAPWALSRLPRFGVRASGNDKRGSAADTLTRYVRRRDQLPCSLKPPISILCRRACRGSTLAGVEMGEITWMTRGAI